MKLKHSGTGYQPSFYITASANTEWQTHPGQLIWVCCYQIAWGTREHLLYCGYRQHLYRRLRDSRVEPNIANQFDE